MLQESGLDSFVRNDVESAYREFRDMLVVISDSSENYTSLFRLLTDLHVRLQLLNAFGNSQQRFKKKYAHLFLSQAGST